MYDLIYDFLTSVRDKNEAKGIVLCVEIDEEINHLSNVELLQIMQEAQQWETNEMLNDAAARKENSYER